MEHYQILAGDTGSWQQRTSLSLDSAVCSLLPDIHHQQEQVKLVTPDSDRKRRGTDPEKQTKHLPETRELIQEQNNEQIVFIAPNSKLC